MNCAASMSFPITPPISILTAATAASKSWPSRKTSRSAPARDTTRPGSKTGHTSKESLAKLQDFPSWLAALVQLERHKLQLSSAFHLQHHRISRLQLQQRA